MTLHETSDDDQPVIRIVPLSALPWPHNPSLCRYIDRVREVAARLRPEGDGTWAPNQAAAADVFAGLTDDEIAACSRHSGDWATIGHIATTLVGDGITHETPDDEILARLMRDWPSLRQRERRWIISLIADPICWDDGNRSLHNGQHRLCALRAAGVEACPVLGYIEPGYQYPKPERSRAHARKVADAYRRGERPA